MFVLFLFFLILRFLFVEKSSCLNSLYETVSADCSFWSSEIGSYLKISSMLLTKYISLESNLCLNVKIEFTADSLCNLDLCIYTPWSFLKVRSHIMQWFLSLRIICKYKKLFFKKLINWGNLKYLLFLLNIQLIILYMIYSIIFYNELFFYLYLYIYSKKHKGNFI